MIDLHCHLIPGIDDGASSWEDTLAMARIAVDDGITTVAVTPHQMPDGPYSYDRTALLEAFGGFKKRLEKENAGLVVMPAAEVYISWEVVERARTGQLLTMGDAGRYVLVELPGGDIPVFVDQLIFELETMGLTPILAHPERHPRLAQEPGILAAWIGKGLLCQLNAGSLSHTARTQLRTTAIRLLEQRMIHFIASDAHDPRRRPPVLSAAVQRAADILGEAEARALVEDNPRAVLDGGRVEAAEPRLSHPSTWMRRVTKAFGFSRSRGSRA